MFLVASVGKFTKIMNHKSTDRFDAELLGAGSDAGRREEGGQRVGHLLGLQMRRSGDEGHVSVAEARRHGRRQARQRRHHQVGGDARVQLLLHKLLRQILRRLAVVRSQHCPFNRRNSTVSFDDANSMFEFHNAKTYKNPPGPSWHR